MHTFRGIVSLLLGGNTWPSLYDFKMHSRSLIKYICFLKGFALTIEAVDKGEPPLRSQVTLAVNVLDVNDNAPVFKKRKYQGFMNKELTDLRNDLQVR